MSAYDEMIAELEPGETVEAIVFGAWGWGSPPGPDGVWPEAYGEPMPPPVPLDMRGRCLSQDDARLAAEGQVSK